MIAEWMARAAKQIQDGYLDDDTWAVQSEGVVAEIIAAHCPPAPRCETCANWEKEHEAFPERGECVMTREDVSENPNGPETQIAVVRGWANLETAHDFGCVAWKERT